MAKDRDLNPLGEGLDWRISSLDLLMTRNVLAVQFGLTPSQTLRKAFEFGLLVLDVENDLYSNISAMGGGVARDIYLMDPGFAPRIRHRSGNENLKSSHIVLADTLRSKLLRSAQVRRVELTELLERMVRVGFFAAQIQIDSSRKIILWNHAEGRREIKFT